MFDAILGRGARGAIHCVVAEEFAGPSGRQTYAGGRGAEVR